RARARAATPAPVRRPVARGALAMIVAASTQVTRGFVPVQPDEQRMERGQVIASVTHSVHQPTQVVASFVGTQSVQRPTRRLGSQRTQIRYREPVQSVADRGVV